MNALEMAVPLLPLMAPAGVQGLFNMNINYWPKTGPKCYSTGDFFSSDNDIKVKLKV